MNEQVGELSPKHEIVPTHISPAELEEAERISSQVQSYEVTEEGVILKSRFYGGGEIRLPFHNIREGGKFYKNLRDAGFPKGGVQ